MRRAALFLPTFALVACGPIRQAPPTAGRSLASAPAQASSRPIAKPSQPVDPAPASSPVAATAPIPETPLAAPRVARLSLGSISATAILFDSRSHQLRVADQPGGPGSLWPDAAAAGKALGGIAAANAGFFMPDGGPLGLVVSQGKEAGALNRSSLGAGFVIAGPSPALIRRERWSGNAGDAVQAGPFLVENGKAVPGLSPASSTARTFLATDGSAHWALVRTGSCSLQELAAALQGADLGGMKAATALNLDGGRSSDLWIAGSVAGGPVQERPFWNKPVRNFLVLVPSH